MDLLSCLNEGFTIINYQEAIEFLLPRHYSGRIPSIMFSFGWFEEGKLKAVCTFGKPASNALCEGVCGKEYKEKVIELNRLCRTEDCKIQLSQFVSKCLKAVKGHIVISYSDTDMKHHGYIYQACNFIYTGATKRRTDKYTEGNKHSRRYDNSSQNGRRKVRSSKHRYIFFSGSKSEKKEWNSKLNYKIENYPKGDNSNYILGNYLETKIIYEDKKENDA